MRIDFHAHILPGMDHGCEDVVMSLAQLKMAADQKIDRIIATSHFYPHVETVSSFLRRRKEAWEKLEEVHTKEYPVITLGAEVLICSNMDKMEGIQELCIENSKVLLLEMPFARSWESNLIDTVVRLREDQGLRVILAHGERYPVKEMEKLLSLGFQTQLNVAATARFVPSQFVRRCMKTQCVAALGSDIHGLHNSYKEFTHSMKKWGNIADQIMERTRELVAGDVQATHMHYQD